MRETMAGRLSVGEFIALYEQAQDYVVVRAREAGQIPPGARSDEVIFEFGRRVESRVRRGLEQKKGSWPEVKAAAQEPELLSREEIRRVIREATREVCGND